MDGSGKLKRFKVTQSLRFTDNISKALFYTALLVEAGSLIAIAASIVMKTKSFLGPFVILAFLSAIWLFSIRLISESRYGLANVSFHETGMVFRQNNSPDAKEYLLRWTDCVEAGIEKTRLSFWVYVSDHKLENKEKKEFPQYVKDGVFYFNYDYNTWEEFMKFVPESFKTELESQWTEKKVR